MQQQEQFVSVITMTFPGEQPHLQRRISSTPTHTNTCPVPTCYLQHTAPPPPGMSRLHHLPLITIRGRWKATTVWWVEEALLARAAGAVEYVPRAVQEPAWWIPHREWCQCSLPQALQTSTQAGRGGALTAGAFLDFQFFVVSLSQIFGITSVVSAQFPIQ